MEAFTTGAYIESQKIEDKWYWIVTKFEDDTFMNGIDVPNIQEVSENETGLTGMNNYRIELFNEGQELNYTRNMRDTHEKATAEAQRIVNNLQKLLIGATVKGELINEDNESKTIIIPTQDSE